MGGLPILHLDTAVFANQTHYGNPQNGCLSDEIAARLSGVNGDACFPQATNNSCPTDVPSGTTASPMAVIQDQSGNRYCGLICSGIATGNCPSGSTCQSVSGAGICMYS